jgi:hypothetical protein
VDESVPILDSDPGVSDDAKWEAYAPLPLPERRRRRRKILAILGVVVVVAAATVYLVGPWGPLDPWTVHVTEVEWMNPLSSNPAGTNGFTIRGGAQVTVSLTMTGGWDDCPSNAGPSLDCGEYASVTSDTGGFGVVQSNLPVSFSGGIPPTNTSLEVYSTANISATVATPWGNYNGPLWLELYWT